MSRVVQTLQDAEIIINRLLNESAEVQKSLKRIEELAKQEESDEIKIERKFFDIANEVEFMRELNLVVHRLHHKFKRVVFEGESRWYDFLGRTPAQWYSQFAVIPDGNNSSLFLRDSANNPIWEIVRRVGGTNVSNWVMYTNLLPPRTNPLDPAGRFNLGGSDFRWDQIFARHVDLDRPALDQPQLMARSGGVNPIGLYSYDSIICSLLMGADATGNTFTARASSAFLIMKENDLLLFGNKSLTSGSVFSPTLLWRFTDIDVLPSGDKNIGSASFRVSTYFGRYIELDSLAGILNTQLTVKSGGLNDIGLTTYDANTCVLGLGVIYTGGNWIAKSNTAAIIFKSTNTLSFYLNGGLTTGGSYSPTLIWQFDGAGHFVPGANKDIGNASNRVRTLYATSLDVTTLNFSIVNATGYQISGVTVIDSARQFLGTNIGITGPGNFASQGYVQADGGFRVSGSLGQSVVNLSYRKGDGTSIGFLTFTGGILTSFS